jgi:hypothetical protein
VKVRRVLAPAVLAAAFFLWHFPLLTAAGRVRGFNSDAAIIALMGKKMLEGRGFDIFFWGQNYIGPLTSMFIAAAGAAIGTVNPLALRIGTFIEILLGIFLAAWAVGRIDRRAGLITAIALVITPPVILRMMITPLGAEMAFSLSAALLCVLLQHLTAPPDQGWLSHSAGQFGFGVLAGISWWMNQQVLFTLLAAALVFGARSHLFTAIRGQLHLLDRHRLRGQAIGWRRLPGVLEALTWVVTRSGYLLLIAFVVVDLMGRPLLPFVIGPFADPLVLILAPQLLLPLLLGEWRRWRLPKGDETGEVLSIARCAMGFAVGYAPVWLGRLLGWYESSYVFGFRVNRPGAAWQHVATSFGDTFVQWTGKAPGPIGTAFAVVLLVLVCAGVLRKRTEARLLLMLIPLINLLFFVAVDAVKPHYMISSAAMLFGLAALGAVDLWDSSRPVLRVALAGAAVVAVLSMGLSAKAMHDRVLAENDPATLLQSVGENGCAVCYADFWIAYRFRLLDGERCAWIPYLSQNRTRLESAVMQKRAGQRCIVEKDWSVVRVDDV